MTPEIQEVLKAEADELHSCYDEAGIIISRPATGSTCRLGVSVKEGITRKTIIIMMWVLMQ